VLGLGARDAGAGRRSDGEPLRGDVAAAPFTASVRAGLEPGQRPVQVGQALPRGGENGGELGPFVRDGAALGVMLVVGIGRPGRLEQTVQILVQRTHLGTGFVSQPSQMCPCREDVVVHSASTIRPADAGGGGHRGNGLSVSDDPALVAGAAFAQQLPWPLFALVSGAYVDRLDRRRIIVTVTGAARPLWTLAARGRQMAAAASTADTVTAIMTR
jgi:hypothetical protein